MAKSPLKVVHILATCNGAAGGKLQPPNLVAMFPGAGFDQHLPRLDHAERSLAAVVQLRLGSCAHAESHHAAAILPFSETYSPPELKYETILKHLPLKDGDLESAGYAVQHYRDWVAHPDYDAYWKAISDEEQVSARYNVPVHTSGGWFDIFLQGTINGFVGVRKHGANEKTRRESRMIIGAWGHGPTQKYGDVDFGSGKQSRNQFETELKWFERYLKGPSSKDNRH